MDRGTGRQPCLRRTKNPPGIILAAADYAEGRGQPPEELLLAWDCRTFGALPEAGGVRDQPAGLLRRMRQALGVFNAFRSWKAREAAKEDEWVERHPTEWQIVQSVIGFRRLLEKSRGRRT